MISIIISVFLLIGSSAGGPHFGEFPPWWPTRATTSVIDSAESTLSGSRESVTSVGNSGQITKVQETTEPESRSESFELSTVVTLRSTRRVSTSTMSQKDEEKVSTSKEDDVVTVQPTVDGAAALESSVQPTTESTAARGTTTTSQTTPSQAPTSLLFTTFGASLPSLSEISNLISSTG